MLKKLIPTSLFKRVILIIILPTILTQIVATYIFYNRHWESVARNMSFSLTNEVLLSYKLYLSNFNQSEREEINSSLGLSFKERKITGKAKFHELYSNDTYYLYQRLKLFIKEPIRIEFIENNSLIKIDILHNYKIISFLADSKRVDNPTTYIFILWLIISNLFFLIIAIIFAKNQLRPIIKLARAADLFGRGFKINNFKPQGAKEIKKAGIAFLQMKNRIEKYISSRTEMLAGISHDLRTPLTRMKLQIELSSDPEIKIMQDDIQEMEYMINSYLEFARDNLKENSRIVSFKHFMQNLLDPYLKNGANIYALEIPNIKIALKVESLRRCFQNLINNAIQYSSIIQINSFIDLNSLIIEIHDNGPGIDLEHREDVFKPFFRIDKSRNKETGGVGLGLAIAQDIINNHGGQIQLDSSHVLKGLKVTITIPL